VTLGLSGGVVVESTATPLEHLPRLSMNGDFLLVGDYASATDREAAYAFTTGSQEWLWSGDDDFRFLSSTGELHSIQLKVPQVRPEAAGPTAPWGLLPVVSGGLRLVALRGFSRAPAVDCWISEDATTFSARYSAHAPDGELLRLRTAPSLDLIFSDGQLAGWLLEQPERYLVTGWEVRAESPPDPELASVLQGFLPYLAEPLVDQITDDADPQLLAELQALESQASSRAAVTGRADALAGAIRKLIEDWY
jgi:hypothetical protein